MDLSEMFPEGDDFQNLFDHVDDDVESEVVLGKRPRVSDNEDGLSVEPGGDLEPQSKRMKTTNSIRDIDSEASSLETDMPDTPKEPLNSRVNKSVIALSNKTPNERNEDIESSNENNSSKSKIVSPPNQIFKHSTKRTNETRKIGNVQSSRKSFVFCDLCPKKFLTRGDVYQHISRDHVQGSKLSCKFCKCAIKNQNINSNVVQTHLKGKRHLMNVKDAKKKFTKPSLRPPLPQKPPVFYRNCEICNVRMPSNEYTDHLRGTRHQAKVRLLQEQKQRNMRPRHNVNPRGFSTPRPISNAAMRHPRPPPVYSSKVPIGRQAPPVSRMFPDNNKPVRSTDPVNNRYQQRFQRPVIKRENEKKPPTRRRSPVTPPSETHNKLKIPSHAEHIGFQEALFKGRFYKFPVRVIANYRPDKFFVGTREVCADNLFNKCRYGIIACKHLHVNKNDLERIIRISEHEKRVKRAQRVDVIARRPSFVEPKTEPKVKLPKESAKKKLAGFQELLFRRRFYKIPVEMIANYRPDKFFVGTREVCADNVFGRCRWGERCKRFHVERSDLDEIIKKSQKSVEEKLAKRLYPPQKERIPQRSRGEVIARRPSFVEPKLEPNVVPPVKPTESPKEKKNVFENEVHCRVMKVGYLVDAKGFHNEEYIYPVSYKSVINFNSKVIIVEIERRIRKNFPIYKMENVTDKFSSSSSSISQAWIRVTDVMPPSNLRDAFGFASVELAKLPDARKYCSMNLKVKKIVEEEEKRKIEERRGEILEEQRKRRESYKKRFLFVRSEKEEKKVFQCEICLVKLGSEESLKLHDKKFHFLPAKKKKKVVRRVEKKKPVKRIVLTPVGGSSSSSVILTPVSKNIRPVKNTARPKKKINEAPSQTRTKLFRPSFSNTTKRVNREVSPPVRNRGTSVRDRSSRENWKTSSYRSSRPSRVRNISETRESLRSPNTPEWFQDDDSFQKTPTFAPSPFDSKKDLIVVEKNSYLVEKYTCPLQLTIMKNPQGNKHCQHNFEKGAIEQYLNLQKLRFSRCPIAGCQKKIGKETIYPNKALKKEIELWKKKKPSGGFIEPKGIIHVDEH